MALVLFKDLSNRDATGAIEKLIADSSPKQDFFLMIGLAVLMASLGLLLGNAAIVIGSMLIAPLLFPLLSLSLGFVMKDGKLISRSILTFVQSTLLGVLLASSVALLFSAYSPHIALEFIGWDQWTEAYVAVAIIAGFAGSFAYIKPQLNEHLSGAAISVALIPPLALIGIGVALVDWTIVRDALLLYGVNCLGVFISAWFVFFMMNLETHRKVAQKAVQKEEKVAQKAVEKARE